MDDDQKEKNQSRFWLIMLGLLLVIVAIVAILLFLITGNTTVSYSEYETGETHSLSCESENVSYPYFTYDNSEKKNLKINAIFKDDTLESISLVYALTYANKGEAEASELKNHIDFEVKIQNEGLTRETLNSDHKIMDNVYQLTMYNSGEELNSKIAKYYLLKSLYKDFTQENVGNAIIKSGLNCVSK